MIVNATPTGFFLELLTPSYEDDRAVGGAPVGHTLSLTERNFLLQLLTPQTFRELLKKTPASLCSSEFMISSALDPSVIIQAFIDSSEVGVAKGGCGLSTVIADPDTSITK